MPYHAFKSKLTQRGFTRAPREGQESISGIGGQTAQRGAGEGQESLNEMLIQATEVRAL